MHSGDSATLPKPYPSPAAGEGSEAPPPGGAGPPAQRLSVCSVWGTTASRRRSELSSTASCGSTVSRAAPTAATAGAQRHRLGDLRAQCLVSELVCKVRALSRTANTWPPGCCLERRRRHRLKLCGHLASCNALARTTWEPAAA